jgi:hypothetical protein
MVSSGRQRLTTAMDRLQVRPRYSSTAESDFSFEHAPDGQTFVDGHDTAKIDGSSPAAGHVTAADGTNHASASSSRSVAQVALEVARMPSLDSDPHLKAAVSHAARQRTGLDSQTGLKCSWLDIYFHIPGTGELNRGFRCRVRAIRAGIVTCKYTAIRRGVRNHTSEMRDVHTLPRTVTATYLQDARACDTAGSQDAQPFIKLDAVIPPAVTDSHGRCAGHVPTEHAPV